MLWGAYAFRKCAGGLIASIVTVIKQPSNCSKSFRTVFACGVRMTSAPPYFIFTGGRCWPLQGGSSLVFSLFTLFMSNIRGNNEGKSVDGSCRICANMRFR